MNNTGPESTVPPAASGGGGAGLCPAGAAGGGGSEVEPTNHNLRAWEQAHRPRAEAEAIPPAVRELFPELAGKHVLHLSCGEATAELAELGGLVTVVDPSADAIAAARGRAPSAAFVRADAQELPTELKRGRFDLVYAGVGALDGLADLQAWAVGIAAALRSGGEIVLYDEHPAALCLDAGAHWREDYFGEGLWRLGQIVTAVAAAGLTVRRLDELASPYRGRKVPGEFVLVAVKA